MTAQTGEISLPISRTDPPKTSVGSKSAEIEIVDASQLCGEIALRWSMLRANNPSLTSPYFDIEFTKAVARVRDDVEIAILKNENDEITAFMPFQRIGEFHAVPVGGRLNDVHGLISLDLNNQAETIRRIMKKAGIKTFDFHALNLEGVKQDSNLSKYVFTELDTHFIDLEAGWAAYQGWYRKHSSTVRRQGQKTRALEREIGPLRFVFDCDNDEILEQLIELKRAKYHRSKTFDILSVDWAADLLREISAVETPGFKGHLSAVFAGDRLMAVHFGMLTDDVLHYWFPVFDQGYSKYSPGTELILQVAKEACERGITKVDFGYGDDPYKFKFCNGHEKVCCGRIGFSNWGFHVAKKRYEIRQKLKGIPMKSWTKAALRKVFPGFGQWNFR